MMTSNPEDAAAYEAPTEDNAVVSPAAHEKTSSDTDHSSHNETMTADEMEAQKAAIYADRPRRTKKFIVLVAVCAALGGLIFGYDIAGAGATFLMKGFRVHFGWDCDPSDTSCVPATQREIDRDQGMINGMFGLGATIGAISAPWVADKFGRRPCLLVASIMFTLGAALQAGAVTMTMMWVARVIAGFGIGGLSMCSPVYIAELAPEHVRGQLSTLWQLAITTGILVASAANLGLERWDQGWRISYGGNILFAVILCFALLFMPESPRFLTGHGMDEKARVAMKKIRFDDEIETEMRELARECQEEKEMGVADWREVFAAKNKQRYRLLLGVGLQGIQQLSGINAIMFYAPTILATFFGTRQSIIGTFILNIINFLSTFLTIATVEKAGRVKLLLSGGVVMCVSLIACSILSSVAQTTKIGYAVVACAAVYIVGFAYSWGPVVWTVCAEMFPVRSRGKSTGITTMTNWAMTTAIGAIFPLASTASLTGCFAFFSGTIILGTVMVYFFQVETAEKTIIEIDEAYANHKPKLKRY
ncbi:glucose import [Mayamaea pseudoterrestris]|nr:glucose import [Mayamaea pseudoterrestris]